MGSRTHVWKFMGSAEPYQIHANYAYDQGPRWHSKLMGSKQDLILVPLSVKIWLFIEFYQKLMGSRTFLSKFMSSAEPIKPVLTRYLNWLKHKNYIHYNDGVNNFSPCFRSISRESGSSSSRTVSRSESRSACHSGSFPPAPPAVPSAGRASIDSAGGGSRSGSSSALQSRPRSAGTPDGKDIPTEEFGISELCNVYL